MKFSSSTPVDPKVKRLETQYYHDQDRHEHFKQNC